MRLGSIETKRHILAVTARLLETTSSEHLRIVDIADDASVAVPTIYYHFESRQRLIAEAQALVFLILSEPLQGLLSRAEAALVERDGESFWDVIGNHILLGWTLGQRDDERGVLNVLRDVRSDPTTRREFDQGVKDSFLRLVNLIDEAKVVGWARPDIDTGALVVSFWAASSGQTIVSNLYLKGISPERIRDLFLDIAKCKGSL